MSHSNLESSFPGSDRHLSAGGRAHRLWRRLAGTIRTAPGFSNKSLVALSLMEHAASRLGHPLGIVERRLKLDRFRIAVQPSGQELLAYWEIFLEHEYDQFIKTLPPASTVLDVGANIGLFALRIVSGDSTARIFSFEPSPAVYSRLEENARLNGKGQIQTFASAVGETAGTLYLEQRGATVNSRIVTSASPNVVEVPVVTLDDVVKANGIDAIDLLKIDTEGFELEVLRGGEKACLRRTKRMVVEYHRLEDCCLIIDIAKRHELALVDKRLSLLFFSREPISTSS